MKYLKLLFCLISCILIFSCASTKTQTENKVQEETIVDSEKTTSSKEDIPTVSFEGFWELIRFEKDGEEIPLVPDTAPNILGIKIEQPENNIYPITGFLGINYFTDGKAMVGNPIPVLTEEELTKEKKKHKKDKDEEEKPVTSIKNEKFSIEEFSVTLRVGPEEHKIFEKLFKESLFGSDSVNLEFVNSIETLTIFNSDMKTSMIFNKKE